MMCEEKMQCLACVLNTTCPTTTRVFVNYCGSMPQSLKEQIYSARIDCRVRRRYVRYYGQHYPKSGDFCQSDPVLVETHS
jgi:hypothetical protein